MPMTKHGVSKQDRVVNPGEMNWLHISVEGNHKRPPGVANQARRYKCRDLFQLSWGGLFTEISRHGNCKIRLVPSRIPLIILAATHANA